LAFAHGAESIDGADARDHRLADAPARKRIGRIIVDAAGFRQKQGSLAVHGLAQAVENAPEQLRPHAHREQPSGGHYFHARPQTVELAQGHEQGRLAPESHHFGLTDQPGSVEHAADFAQAGRKSRTFQDQSDHLNDFRPDGGYAHFLQCAGVGGEGGIRRQDGRPPASPSASSGRFRESALAVNTFFSSSSMRSARSSASRATEVESDSTKQPPLGMRSSATTRISLLPESTGSQKSCLDYTSL